MTKDDEFHGLAATIRSATESETFDFGNLPSTTISQVVRDAFSKDFVLQEMIRITLVIGAGKGNRSKYDPAALKLVTSELTAAGYAEDKGASCTVESAGCYKFQHDTGKNLKTVVVFPKLAAQTAAPSATSSASSSSLLPPASLEYKIAVSTMALFTNMLRAKFPSWSQKRALSKLIDETLVERLEQLDATLIQGKLLSEDERVFYEQCVAVSEKKGLVRDAMSQQVRDEQLTESEVRYLLDQLEERLQDTKHKNPAALKERQQKLQSILKHPVPPAPLKHHAALGKLWKQAAPLLYLNNSGAKLLSPSETKKKGQLEDILGEIAELEASSRGLLEDDETYDERIRTYRRDLQQRFGSLGGGTKNRNTTPSSSSSSNSNGKSKNAWSSTKYHTPSIGGNRASSSAWKDKKKKKGGKTVDVFGAMMADSGSESEDDDESSTTPDDTTDATRGTKNDAALIETKPANNNTSGSSKNKKKHKKKKHKNNKNKSQDDDAILNAAVAANADKESSSKRVDSVEAKDSGVVSTIFSLFWLALTEYTIPILLAVLTWLATALFGKSKGKKKKA